MPVTVHFQSSGAVPGGGTPVELRGPSLSIGRSLENDLVLPDPEKILSKLHCVLHDQDGGVVVVDHSSNGTFLNYGKMPLGPVPTPLSDGDVLSLGPYELMVSISTQNTTLDPGLDELSPFDQQSVSHGHAAAADGIADLLDGPSQETDFLDDLLGESNPSGPSAVARPELGEDGLLPPLGDDDISIAEENVGPSGPDFTQSQHEAAEFEHFQPPSVASTIPDGWDDDFFAGIEPAKPDLDIPEGTNDASVLPPNGDPELGNHDLEADDPFQEQKEVEPVPAVQPSKQTSKQPQLQAETGTPAASVDAALAFLRALEAGDLTQDGEDLEEVMERLGRVMRVLIHGMREILMTRASLKSEFRIQQTMISAGGNNPFKFSVSPEQAIQAIVDPPAKGYLNPVEAAEQALQDIKAHEVAVMAGMEAALKGLLGRLSPGEVSKQLDSSGGVGGLLKGKKARYWEVYEKMYAEISDQAENDFHDLFSRAFVRAYQEQLDRLK